MNQNEYIAEIRKLTDSVKQTTADIRRARWITIIVMGIGTFMGSIVGSFLYLLYSRS